MYQFVRETLDRFDDSNDDEDYDFEAQYDDDNNSQDVPSKPNRLKRRSAVNPQLTSKRSCLSEFRDDDSSRLCFDGGVILETDPYPTEKLTRGKQKIPIQFIEDRTRRYSTFSKRKTGLMKKAFELAELTGAEVLLLVASETNHVYTFATHRLKNIIELDSGKNLIQSCLSSNRTGVMAGSKKTNETVLNSETNSKYHHQSSQIGLKADGVDGQLTNDDGTVATEPLHKDSTILQSDDLICETVTVPENKLKTKTKFMTPKSNQMGGAAVGDKCTKTEDVTTSSIVETLPASSSPGDLSIVTKAIVQSHNQSPPNLPTSTIPPVILTGLFPSQSSVLLSTQMTTNQFLILSPPWNPIPGPVENNASTTSQTFSLTNSGLLAGQGTEVNLSNLLNVNTGHSSTTSYSLSIPLLKPPDNLASASITAAPMSLTNTTSVENTSAIHGCILKKS